MIGESQKARAVFSPESQIAKTMSLIPNFRARRSPPPKVITHRVQLIKKRRVQGSNLLELALTSFQDSRITVLPTLLKREARAGIEPAQ